MKDSQLNVNFVLRADGARKPGGDTSKAARFCAELVKLGHRSVVTYGLPESGSHVDVVHLVNLDLPLENLHLAREVKKQRKGVGVVLSTVHHPHRGLEEFFKLGDDRFNARCRRLGLTFDQSQNLREVLKLLRRAERVGLSDVFGGLAARQRELLDAVDVFLPMTSGEAAAVISDFRTTTQSHIVPNGITYGPANVTDQKQTNTYDVCVVGRIEPRKNSLSMARALSASKLRAVFIGAENLNHPNFVSHFRRCVDESDNLTFTGRLDGVFVRTAMQASSCYLNPAWVEVVSQADIEAASLGLRVASTKYSYLEDVLNQETAWLNPEDVVRDESGEYVRWAYQVARRAAPPQPYSWRAATEELVRAYHKLES